VILIRDDGKGFENGAAAIDADGLINMRDRLETIHGTCIRRSIPGQGTTVEMRVPMNWGGG
jgi:signal transduction histidine kinase